MNFCFSGEESCEEDEEFDPRVQYPPGHPGHAAQQQQQQQNRLIQTVPAKEPRMDAVPLKSAMKKAHFTRKQQQQQANMEAKMQQAVEQQQHPPSR